MIPISTKPAEALYQWPRWVFSCPDRTTLIYETKDGQLASLKWSDLVHAVHDVRGRMQDFGVQVGDRIVHRCGNSLDGILVALASAASGTIEVPLEPTVDPNDLRSVIEQVDGNELPHDICSNLLPPMNGKSWNDPTDKTRELLERQASFKPESPSLILMTSGTSGRSKAVTLSRQSLSINAAAKLAAVPQTSDDIRLTLLPLCHAYARTCDLGTWLLSGSVLAITSGWQGWERFAPEVRPTLINTVPSIASRLLQLPSSSPEMSRLRLVGCGGAALNADAFEQFRARGITVIQGYGMTETAPVICSATPENARPGFVGTPVATWQTRIDADGRLSVRGKCAMIGYWNDVEATALRCVDGWIDTGDIVEVDPVDGQYRILGRADYRITLSNGRKLYPMPIEQRVLTIPQVRHAILVAADRRTELWLDVDCSKDVIAGQENDLESLNDRVANLLSDLPAWQMPKRILRMPQSLKAIPGMLTAKGTPVRPRVIELVRQWRIDLAIDDPLIDAAEQ